MDISIINKVENFFSKFPLEYYKKGELLISAGRQPTGIFFVASGIVRRYWITEKGEETTLNLYKPNSFLPMSWAISDVKNIHFYEAMTDLQVRKAPKEEVLAFLKDEPDVLLDLLRRVYIGLEGLWMHIEYLTTGNSYTKLVASLVILAKRFGKKGNGNDIAIELKMTGNELANYAGMSRETANRELHKLKQAHLVDFIKGKITIHDLKKLEEKHLI